jgi:hypothetical protein
VDNRVFFSLFCTLFMLKHTVFTYTLVETVSPQGPRSDLFVVYNMKQIKVRKDQEQV